MSQTFEIEILGKRNEQLFHNYFVLVFAIWYVVYQSLANIQNPTSSAKTYFIKPNEHNYLSQHDLPFTSPTYLLPSSQMIKMNNAHTW